MNIRIGIFTDLRFTSLTTPTGVTKHIVEMVNGLDRLLGVELIVLATKDQLTPKGQIPDDNALSHFKARALPYNWHSAYFCWLCFGSPKMDKYASDVDWVYCPKNDFIPFKNVKPVVPASLLIPTKKIGIRSSKQIKLNFLPVLEMKL